MGRHRLADPMASGYRWSHPDSGVVFVTASGDIQDVARGVIGSTGRTVDTGRVWTPFDIDEAVRVPPTARSTAPRDVFDHD